MNRTSAEPSPLRYRTSPKYRPGRDPPDGDRGSRLSACAQLLGRLTGGFLPLTVEPVGAMKNQLDSCTRRHETRAGIELVFACRGPFGVNWCKTSVREPRRISRIHSGEKRIRNGWTHYSCTLTDSRQTSVTVRHCGHVQIRISVLKCAD